MENGWLKIFRKFTKWEWYTNSNMVHLFIHLLLTANSKDRTWMGVEVKRGQVITGRKQLSIETGISEQSIRTCLVRLERTKEISTKSTNKYSIITICNYETYQEKNQATNQQLTSNQPAINQQSTSNQPQTRSKEVKNKDNRARFTPPTHQNIIDYCSERKNNVSAKRFFDFYESKGWMVGKNKMKDWKAAVRTWEEEKQKESPRPVFNPNA